MRKIQVQEQTMVQQTVAEVKTNLISFTNGAYKKVDFIDWGQSQWIHYTRPDGTRVRINPANVNYIEEVNE